MALKRLDEEFLLKPGTQLLPYMRRLLPALEARFQVVEGTAEQYSHIMDEIRASALMRMNEILIPATEDIIEVTKLGFLLAPSSTPHTLEIGVKYFYVDEGPQRDTFTPSPYLILERQANHDDYAICRMLDYVQETGELVVQITAHHGNPGPHTDWVFSSTPGMADSTKLYHDAIAPMHLEVTSNYDEIVVLHGEILAAAQALEESGLDVQNFIRRDGSLTFTGVQRGVHPAAGSNDTAFATTAWARARMIEYSSANVTRSGDTMSGPLSLSGAPTQPLHAVTKAYVDNIAGTINSMASSLTITTVNPSVRLRPTSPGQNRAIEGLADNASARWTMLLGDSATESGGNAGSNFALYRFTDGGGIIDSPLSVNRQNGTTNVRALNISGAMFAGGGATVSGDLSVYRPGTPTTGVIYLNQSNSAYHYFDGTTHQILGGPLNLAGQGFTCGAITAASVSTNGGNMHTNGGTLFLNAANSAYLQLSGGQINLHGGPVSINNTLNCGALNCTTLSTQGYYATVWGLTSHGSVTVNGNETINGSSYIQALTITSGAPTITLNDNEWAPMYIHHNGGDVGFLNNSFSWVMRTNPQGHLWLAAYGWMHDYVWGTANNVATSVANNLFSQIVAVTNMRLVHAGDHIRALTIYSPSSISEPYNGGIVTYYSNYSTDSNEETNKCISRYRYVQYLVSGTWYTTHYA